MREFLDQTFGEKSTVNDFVHSMINTQWAESDKTLPPALYLFESAPAQVTRDLFTFISTAPRELSEEVGQLLKATQGMVLSEDDRIELKVLSDDVLRMGNLMDEFTKSIAKGRSWASIYNAPVKVTRVWRTKRNEEVIGEPEERNLPIDQVPNRLTSLVLVEEETNKGKRTRPMLCVSDGQYRDDGSSFGPVREDFLIDLAAMFEHGSNVAPRGRVTRGCSKDHTQKIFTAIMNDSLRLFESILDVAKPLIQRGIIDSTLYDFTEKEQIASSKPLTAEENPDAKYEIGGWA